MKKFIVALCLFIPTLAYSAEPQRINFNEYNKKIKELASECTSKGMPHFNGFCLSQKHGTPKYEDQTQTSITVALELTNFEQFYKKCEHSDFSNVNDLLNRALNIGEAKQFIEEMKPQKEALETQSNYFYYCKTKDENNVTVSKKLKWFEYMISKYSNDAKIKYSGKNNPTLQLSSKQPMRKVVECILDQYRGAAFFASGIPTNDGSITIQLIAPEIVPLAIVSNNSGGSTTRYLNVKNSDNKVIPQADTFDKVINNCQ